MSNYKSIDSIRGIFSLLIVWHHFAPILGIRYNADLGYTIVLFFFVLSGFHISLTWKDKISGNEKGFIIKRCAKIFPLQWITTTLFIIFNINIISLWAIPFHLTLTQSIIPFWSINFAINASSWFLSSLFFCYLVTPFILEMSVKYIRLFTFFIFLYILFFSIFLYILPDSIGHRWLNYISPFSRFRDYGVGISLGIYYVTISQFVINERLKETYSKILFTILELLFSLALFYIMINKSIPYTEHYVYYFFVLPFILIFTWEKGYISKLLSNRILHFIGSISMAIYMTHGFILHFCHLMDGFSVLHQIIIFYTLIILFAYIVNLILPYISSRFMRIVGND